MIRYLSVAALLAIGATIAFAQGAGGAKAIEDRKAAMKSMGGAIYRTANQMAKGEAPFDMAKALASFKTVTDTVPRVKELFPDDSKTGDHETQPAAWEKKGEFIGRFDKLGATATAAAAATKDEATFKAEFQKVVGSCNDCHKEYRKPRR